MTRSRRILHVIHSGAIGGGPRVVLDLATRVDAEHMIASSGDGPLLDDARATGIEVTELKYAGEFSFALSVPAVRQVAKQVDLVHLHGQFAAFYGSIASTSAHVHSVYTAHFPSFVTDWTLVRRVRNRVAETVPCRLTQHVVACSQSSREEFIRRRLVPPARISTIYNGVHDVKPSRTGTEIRAELGLKPDDLMVLAIGRLSPQKGFDLLLRALPIVQAAVPTVKVIVAGDGESRNELERQVETQRMGQSVQFTGFRRDTRELMEAASVVAVPSRYDIFPLVPLEAMMAARAVVATDLPALREAVTDHQTGRLAAGIPEAFAQALIDVLRDPGLRNQMGNEGREVALRSFSASRMAEEYASLYTRVLGKAKA